MDKGTLTPLAACRIKGFGIGCFIRVQNGTLLLYIHHEAYWAFAGRDFRLQLPGSSTLVSSQRPFSRIFSVSYAIRPRSCRPAHSPSHSSVKAFLGRARIHPQPFPSCCDDVHYQLANAMLLILSPALPAIFHSLPRLEVGIAWLRATPKPSWQ